MITITNLREEMQKKVFQILSMYPTATNYKVFAYPFLKIKVSLYSMDECLEFLIRAKKGSSGEYTIEVEKKLVDFNLNQMCDEFDSQINK